MSSHPNNSYNPHQRPATVAYDPSGDIIPVDQNDIIRLKIFIPLSTLTAIFSNLVCALLIKPSMGDINDQYYTLLTPSKILIGFYWLVIFASQFGMAFLVVCTSNQRYRTEETKQTFVHAIGMKYVVALFGFALWPIFWAAELFLISNVLLLIVFVLMTYTLYSIWRHPAPSFASKPFSFVFIYLPVHLFQIILFTVDLPQSLLLSLKWYRSPVDHSWERHFTTHAWIVFGIVLLIGTFNALIVYRTHDFIRMIAVVYLSIALLVNANGSLQKVTEAPQVASAVIASAAMCIISFIAQFINFGPSSERIVLVDSEGQEDQPLRS